MNRPGRPVFGLKAVHPMFIARTLKLDPEENLSAKAPCPACGHGQSQLNCEKCAILLAAKDTARLSAGQALDIDGAGKYADEKHCPCALVYAYRLEWAEERRGAAIVSMAEGMTPLGRMLALQPGLGRMDASGGGKRQLRASVRTLKDMIGRHFTQSSRRDEGTAASLCLAQAEELDWLDAVYLAELILFGLEADWPGQVTTDESKAITRVLCHITSQYR
jgi:hypothetical protein